MAEFQTEWSAGLRILGSALMSDVVPAIPPAPLDLVQYPVVRQLSMTEHDCDLLSRVLTIVLGQCETAAAAADPLAMLSASWLRDEIKRLGMKFAGA